MKEPETIRNYSNRNKKQIFHEIFKIFSKKFFRILVEKIFIFFESFFMEIQNQQNKNLQQIQTQTQTQTQTQIQHQNIIENVSGKDFDEVLNNLEQSFKDPEIRGVYERLKDK